MIDTLIFARVYNLPTLSPESHVEAVWEGVDSAQQCDALLLRGQAALLRGNYRIALQAFAKIEDLRPFDVLRLWRAKSYAYVTRGWQYNLFPDGRGASAIDIEQRYDGIAHSKQMLPQLNQLRERLVRQGKPIQLEYALINNWLTSLLSARSFVDKTHHQSDHMRPQLLQQGLSTVVPPVQMTAPLSELVGLGNLLAADLCRRAGDWQQAEQYLQAARQYYVTRNEAVGGTLCDLTALDFQLAPLSTPLLWNCAIVEGGLTSELDWQIERQEFGPSGLDLPAMMQAYQQVRTAFEAAAQPVSAAQVTMRLVFLAWLRGDYAEARQLLDSAETIFATYHDAISQQYAKLQRALLAIAAGEMPERRDLAEQVGQWGRENGAFSFTLGLGIFCLRMGRYWLTRSGAPEKSLAAFRLGEHLFRALDAPISLAQALTDRATVYQFLGENNSAGQLYKKAVMLFEAQLPGNDRASDQLAYRIVHVSTAMLELYNATRNAEQIERLAARLHQLNERQSWQHSDASSNGVQVLAQLWRSVEDAQTTQASAAHEMAIWSQLWMALEGAEFNVPLFRAKRAERVGDTETARQQYQYALQIAQRTKGVDSRIQRIREASVYGSLRQYEEAERIFRSVMRLSADDDPLIAAMRRFGLDDQFSGLMQSRNLSHHQQAASFFTRIRRYDAALAQFHTVEGIAGADWWQHERRPWETLCDYAGTYEGLERDVDALRYYDLAIASLEQRRATLSRDELKIALMGNLTVSLIYLGAARTAMRLARHNPDQHDRYLALSFSYAESGKGRALQDLIDASVNGANGQTASQNELIARWRAATMAVATWRGLSQRAVEAQDDARAQQLQVQTKSAEKERIQLERQLAADNPKFYQLVNPQSKPLSLRDVQAELGPDTLLVEYMFHDDTLLIWTISRETAHGHFLKRDTFVLNGQIDTFYELCCEPSSSIAEIRRLGGQIAESLLVPIKTQLAQFTRLLFVPHGSAHRLPFHALTVDGDWLAATHLISYRPNASSLRVGAAHPISAETTALIVGNPANMSVPHFLSDERVSARRLSGAMQEAFTIAAQFPHNHLLIGSDATETAVRAHLEEVQLIHLATHGYLSAEFPLLSSILLANGDVLTVSELAGIQLDADLVVLSACATGVGEQTSGDEIIGLTRGLLGAGARRAIVTLWPVADKTTQMLMARFYDALLGGETVAAALRAAQQAQWLQGGPSRAAVKVRDLRRRAKTSIDPRHPFFWAAFYYVG